MKLQVEVLILDKLCHLNHTCSVAKVTIEWKHLIGSNMDWQVRKIVNESLLVHLSQGGIGPVKVDVPCKDPMRSKAPTMCTSMALDSK